MKGGFLHAPTGTQRPSERDVMCDHGDTEMVEVLIDAGLSHSGEAVWRLKPIDQCIAPIVRGLQSAGVNMLGSCCGHGEQFGEIALADGRSIVLCRTDSERPSERDAMTTEVTADERAQWEALRDTDTATHLMLPIEAHVASVRHLAGRLLELTDAE